MKMQENKGNFSWNVNKDIHPAYECFLQALLHYGFTTSYENIMQSIPKNENQIKENFEYIAGQYNLPLNMAHGNFKDLFEVLKQNKVAIFSWQFEDSKNDQVVHLREGVDHYSLAYECSPDSLVFFASPENIFSQFINKELQYFSYSPALNDFVDCGKIRILDQFFIG